MYIHIYIHIYIYTHSSIIVTKMQCAAPFSSDGSVPTPFNDSNIPDIL